MFGVAKKKSHLIHAEAATQLNDEPFQKYDPMLNKLPWKGIGLHRGILLHSREAPLS